jgi:hypothetical protein
MTNTGFEEFIDALPAWTVECQMGPQSWCVRVFPTFKDVHCLMLSIKAVSQYSPLGVIEDE